MVAGQLQCTWLGAISQSTGSSIQGCADHAAAQYAALATAPCNDTGGQVFYSYAGRTNGTQAFVDRHVASATGTTGSCPRASTVPFLSSQQVIPQQGCPAGYTVSGSNCVLSNASAVQYPADAKCEMKMVGGVFSYDTRDPDCTGTLPQNYVLSSDGRVIELASGVKRSVVTSVADGTLRVEEWSGRGDGTSDVATLTFSAQNGTATDGGVNLTGGSTQRVVGEGSGVTSTPTSGSGTMNCPDCAKEVTQQRVASAVETIRDEGVKIKETGTPTEGDFASADTKLDDAATAREDAIRGSASQVSLGFSWGLGLPDGAACSPIAFGSNNYAYSWNWCPLLSNVRSLWAWFVSLFMALYVWRRATGSIGEGR